MFDYRFLNKDFIERLKGSSEEPKKEPPVEKLKKTMAKIEIVTTKEKEEPKKLPGWRLVQEYKKQNKRK